MNHASNLMMRTLCGIRQDELPDGDRSLAALIPETQADVDCPECRNKLGLESRG